jgi:Cu(I)/Ag(I) efflux system membrane fusion protein/cobalt-zinc-cadmium efflux system membrane fusion protein
MKTWIKWLTGATGAGVLVLAGVALGTTINLSGCSPGGRHGSGPTSGVSSTQPKQLYTCGMHPQVVQDHPGTCPICHMKLTPMHSGGGSGASGGSGSAQGQQKKILYWWDPMLGAASISDRPGKSAMGMDLVPVYEEGAIAGPRVTIDPTVVQNMGVRTAQVTRGPLDVTIRTVGMLKVPEPGLHDVTLRVGGWVEKLYADTDGMHVRAGEPLFELYSPDLQVAAEELISAVRTLKTIDPAAGEAVKKDAQSLVDSAKRKLRLWAIAEQDVDAIAAAERPPRTIPFRSPGTGHIVEKAVVQGSAVQSSTKLMRIEDHSKMWLDAEVYQGQVPLVSMGQPVEATVEGVPGKTFSGKISFVYPHVDHMSRTQTVRTTLDNPELQLRPGMYATARLVARPVADALLVPREAVIDTGTRQIAFVAQGDGHFDPRKVRTGLAGDDGKVQVLEGLAPGESVVTSGQFLMDVESRTIEAIEKLRRPASQPELLVDAGAARPRSPATTAAATSPVATNAAEPLVVANCSMRKADWIQRGETIANPYYGSSMSTCGTVTKQLKAPTDKPALGAVLGAYLRVQAQFNADKFDPESVAALKTAGDALAGEEYAAVREAIGKMADAKELKTARDAFRTASARLIAVLERAAK